MMAWGPAPRVGPRACKRALGRRRGRAPAVPGLSAEAAANHFANQAEAAKGGAPLPAHRDGAGLSSPAAHGRVRLPCRKAGAEQHRMAALILPSGVDLPSPSPP